MSNVKALLTERLKKSEQSSKMAAMAKQSANGNLTSFSGVFNVSELNAHEKQSIEQILKEYAPEEFDHSHDLKTLLSLTSEVKAINHQAALLHGERIKKVHEILIHYRDGAFTAWLINVYGNRQTPYNFLQYFEFYDALPKTLRPQIEAMPRQAVYALASRQGPFEKKQALIENYKGETKAELLIAIREIFPLSLKDKRRQNAGEAAIQGLTKLLHSLQNGRTDFSKAQQKTIFHLLEEIQSLVSNGKTIR